jgi:hypothetical protein
VKRALLALSLMALAPQAGSAALATALAPLASHGDLHGQFLQEKKVAGLPKPLRSKGDFDLLKGKGLVWRTRSPLQGTVVLGPRGVWALQAGALARRLAAGGEALDLMSRLLSMDPATLQASFDVKVLRARAGFRFELTPRSPLLAKVFTRIDVQGQAQVEQADLAEASGDSTRIKFIAVLPKAGPLAADEEALLAP